MAGPGLGAGILKSSRTREALDIEQMKARTERRRVRDVGEIGRAGVGLRAQELQQKKHVRAARPDNK